MFEVNVKSLKEQEPKKYYKQAKTFLNFEI
jgi:hypothetical protein